MLLTLLNLIKVRKEKEAQIQEMKLQAQTMINNANKVVDVADQMNEIQATGT